MKFSKCFVSSLTFFSFRVFLLFVMTKYLYIVGHKNVHFYFNDNSEMWTDLNNSFTVALSVGSARLARLTWN